MAITPLTLASSTTVSAAKARPEWLPLLSAPDVASRQLGIEKIGDRDTEEVAEALLLQIKHPDRALRETALARLTKLEHGRKALTAALLEAETPDQAWTLARTQAPFAADYPPEWRMEVFAKACSYIEADDRRAEPLLFLLRETDRSITDVCFDVGFNSLGTFSRTFHDIVGETPSQYRTNHPPIEAPHCFQMAQTRPRLLRGRSS